MVCRRAFEHSGNPRHLLGYWEAPRKTPSQGLLASGCALGSLSVLPATMFETRHLAQALRPPAAHAGSLTFLAARTAAPVR